MVRGNYRQGEYRVPIMVQVPNEWGYYPLPGRFDTPVMRSGRQQPRPGFRYGGAYTQDLPCQCRECQRSTPMQVDRYLKNNKKTNGSNGRVEKSSGLYREIPIHFENCEKKPQEPLRFDNAVKLTSDKGNPTPASNIGHSKAGDAGETSLNNNVVAAQTLPERRHEKEVCSKPGKAVMETENLQEAVNGSSSSVTGGLSSSDSENAGMQQLEDNEMRERKLSIINEVLADVEKLSEQVETFTGKERCKEYLYLEEMFMKCLLKLDDISTDGIIDVRTSRKRVADLINHKLKYLEEKLECNSDLQDLEN